MRPRINEYVNKYLSMSNDRTSASRKSTHPTKQLGKTLVLAEDVNLKWQKIVNTVRNKLLGVPSKAQQQLPDLDDSAINTLDSIIREALEELASV